ncbi:hypothetical protein A2Z33_03030 [Candidatus Gottesmanbacteria bacterium RBG_16_52_11]|uniref:Uncharacterized protein n=1 Tax=Candidatus Gottesmanbacteria bacterium RBG_16_52_11 TaxID=1798374 RepID=A0A1F5YW38_9BACT|nr:MAG: hypothetical protein A2Z33_03030 [Candidatus Gottesmanbacteria bacterium RBG_16_52_11]
MYVNISVLYATGNSFRIPGSTPRIPEQTTSDSSRKTDPTNKESTLGLSTALTGDNRLKYDSLVNFWQNVVSDKPDYRDALLTIAVLEYNRGNTEASAKALESALALDPNDIQARQLELSLKKVRD